MYSKIQITGILEVVTGMHIGGSSAFSAIGAVDAPVIKDIRTNRPMIPGSSLKGKMRTLLAKRYNEIIQANPNNDDERITRVFGSAKKDDKGKVKPSKILISDMFVVNEDEIRNRGIQNLTEVKFENSINRATADAMRMLQYDYLGGSGSRGYGKVKFYNLKADNVIGDVDENIKKQINELLSEI